VGLFHVEARRGIMIFLSNYVRFEKPEINRIFDEEVDKLNSFSIHQSSGCRTNPAAFF
jgi:hypothetical protein